MHICTEKLLGPKNNPLRSSIGDKYMGVYRIWHGGLLFLVSSELHAAKLHDLHCVPRIRGSLLKLNSEPRAC